MYCGKYSKFREGKMEANRKERDYKIKMRKHSPFLS